MNDKSGKTYDLFMMYAVLLLTVFGFLFLFKGCAVASGISDENAVRAIIGEAENQGYQGMKAVACGIRNRGTLKGVYGLNAPRVKKHKYSEQTEAMALVAWETSSDPDECRFLGGARYWENVKAFGKPTWASKMIETYRHKDHVFYKEDMEK